MGRQGHLFYDWAAFVLSAMGLPCAVCGYNITASLAQLVEHTLRKRAVMGSIPIGGSVMLRHVVRRIVGLWRWRSRCADVTVRRA